VWHGIGTDTSRGFELNFPKDTLMTKPCNFLLKSLSVFILLLAWSCNTTPEANKREPDDYTRKLQAFRAQKDLSFQSESHSPLPRGARAEFHGLKYYPVNPSLRFELPLHRLVEPDTIQIMTNRGKDRPALRYGYFTFEILWEPQKLFVYKFLDTPKQQSKHLFVPFLDATSGDETYGGGRYLDLMENDSGTYVLDFNLAYNPSCAYGRKNYVCPLPPAENTLSVPIRAGEKRWH